MAIQKITKRVVDATKAGDTDTFLWDSEVRGFGLRTWPSGRKTYVVRFRMPGAGRRGANRRITLGDHGALTPDEARKLAKRELGKVASGTDLAADRRARRGIPTVKELGEAYLEHVELHRKETTAYEYNRQWQKHVLPALGQKQVPSVTSSDIRKLQSKLAGTPYIANRVVALVGAFFTFAAQEKVIKKHENPAHEVEPFAETRRERFLTPSEFKRLGNALLRAEETGLPTAPEYAKTAKSTATTKHRAKTTWGKPIPANPYALNAIRLLALSGCREMEIVGLRWDAVDLERGFLRLADSKTGKSVRAIGAAACALLKQIPTVAGNPHVFPGAKEGKHLGDVQRVWYAVRHAAGLRDVRLHDLRHSFASASATSGDSLLIIKSLLGHARIATTERYAHLLDDPVKTAATKTSTDIAAWMADQSPR